MSIKTWMVLYTYLAHLPRLRLVARLRRPLIRRFACIDTANTLINFSIIRCIDTANFHLY